MNMHHPPRRISLNLHKTGATEYKKISFPVHAGIYTTLETADFIFHFNLNNEILRMKGKGEEWPHPHEWLKRNLANDWTFYSTGGYTGVFEAIGEYYLPNFNYPTNNLLGGRPFDNPAVNQLIENWYVLLQETHRCLSAPQEAEELFFADALTNTPQKLAQRQKELHELIGGPISVLPPDARHVDYNVVPLPVSRGCLYKCRFCKVKNHLPFTTLPDEEITATADRLAAYLADDLPNYNAVFLGDHDALLAGGNHLISAAEQAYKTFRFRDSYCPENRIFLFGSVGSLLNAPDDLFDQLNKVPCLTYINIGLESADQESLDRLGKPIRATDVRKAFLRMQEINRRYLQVEMTANFIMDDTLPANHYPSILELIRDSQTYTRPKGSVYFSPLTFSAPSRGRLFDFHRLKVLSRLPTFLYIIQRL